MSEVGDGTFAFMHQTFLEFFFARHLDGKFDSVEDLLNELYQKIIAQEWDVVSHLALQLKTHGNLRKQDEALKWLSARMNQYKARRQSFTLRAFAARSLEYLSGTESALLSMLKQMDSVPRSYGSEQIRTHLDSLNLALKSVRQRAPFVKNALAGLLAENLLSDRIISDQLKVVLAPTTERGPRYELTRWDALRDISENVRTLARERINQRAMIDGDFASLALQWYGTYYSGAIERFGLTPFMKDFLHYYPASGINWIAIASYSEYQSSFTIEGFALTGLDLFLNELQSVDFSKIPKLDRLGAHMWEIPIEVWERIITKDHKSAVG
jgi:hypothetical protein